ncbi:sterol-binding protein [Aliidongia dinghuensis]|uniref:Sterol-binding protein n=1 Tax=Aliidongia dinghuensis TaxID=1867774 RepID=A0A8J3E2E3_9PROT|nr:SCP2 sterol-binding domain-containing protein [Aliidongia dinghuensis]GGF09514.1 sterol-binding protein [Aliidongia dinghuensis]
MSLEVLTRAVKEKAAQNVSLGHTVLFDLGSDGVIFWDGTQNPAVITNEQAEAETVLKLSADSLRKMLDGAMNATLAYMTGSLKISGSMGVALKINSMMED